MAVLSVLAHRAFDARDFSRRWRRARIAALKPLMTQSPLRGQELHLLRLLPPERREEALRGVFDNSWKLGRSAVRYLGLLWELSDLHEVLANVGIPCLTGRWAQRNGALVLSREGCPPALSIGSFYCDYWREAIDGLVMGVGGDERYARHASRGHGDAQCVDVFFLESGARDPAQLRLGPVPPEMLSRLRPVQERFQQRKTALRFDGFSEGTLFYRLESATGPLCGVQGQLFHSALQRDINAIFPQLRLQDAAPLAVYGEGTR